MSDIDDDDIDLAEIESRRKQREKARIKEATSEWVWIVEAQCFVRRADFERWSDKQWSSKYAELLPKGNILQKVMRTPGYIDKFERLQFLPGEPPVIGDRIFNLWRPSGVEPREGEVQWFLDHVYYLFPDPEVAEAVLDYMALLVQEPWNKILFAMLIFGKHQGTGKSLLVELIKQMLGPHNCRTPSNDQISDRYTDWAEGTQLAIISEMMMLGRRQVANRFKDIITEPELSIRPMYRPNYTIPNRMNVIAMSNHADALQIENFDRRWFIAESPVEPRSPEYYDRLYQHVIDREGVAAVKYFLQHRKVTMNPKGRAPITQAKIEMAEKSLPDDEAYLMELFEEGEAPFDFDLLRRDDIVQAVRARFPHPGRNLLGRIDTLLKDRIGAVRHNHTKNSSDGRKKYRLWSVRNHEKWTAAGPAARLDAYDAYQRNQRAQAIRGQFLPEEPTE